MSWALGRLRQEVSKIKASLCYMVRSVPEKRNACVLGSSRTEAGLKTAQPSVLSDVCELLVSRCKQWQAVRVRPENYLKYLG